MSCITGEGIKIVLIPYFNFFQIVEVGIKGGAETAQLFYILHDLRHLTVLSQPSDTGCCAPEIAGNTTVPKYSNSPTAIQGHLIPLIQAYNIQTSQIK